MFEKFGPEEWTVFIGVIGIMFTLAGGTFTVGVYILRYIIDVERNTSSSAASLESLKSDNDKDHEVIHDRIDGAIITLNQHGNTLVEHGLEIKGLKGAAGG